jgi:ABC-type transporter Mla subunit MlaD
MNEFRKNIVVGAVVLTALIALGAMIILFGEAPQSLSASYRVDMYFSTAASIQNDDPVYVNGVQVGQVDHTAAMDDIRQGVRIVCLIQTRYHIPIDALPVIREQGVGFGKSSIRIDVNEQNSSTMLPTNGSGKLHGSVGGGMTEIIPKQTIKTIEDAGAALADLARGLRPVADDLHALLKPTTTQEVDASTQPNGLTTGPAHPLANLSTAVQRLDQTLKGLNQIVADPNNQNNIRVTLENFRTVSRDAASLAKELREVTGRTDQRLEKISAGLIENTDKLSFLLDSLKTASDKLSSGQGSAGKFLTDPELYDALTFSAQKLALAINDLHELLQQWREKGLKVQGGLLGK